MFVYVSLYGKLFKELFLSEFSETLFDEIHLQLQGVKGTVVCIVLIYQ